MKRFLINTLKVIMLPVIVYLIFLVICFERFSNWNCIYTIFIQTIIPTITAYAIAYGNICGVFDFTIGSRLVISGVIGGLLAAQYGFAGMILGAIISAIVVGIITGVLNWWLKIPSLVLTMGLAMVFEIIGSKLAGHYGFVQIDNKYAIFGSSPNIVIIFLLSAVLFYFVFNHTVFSFHMRAVGSNEAVAKNSGIKTDLVKCKSFVYGSVFIGIAAILTLSQSGSVGAQTSLGSVTIMFKPLISVLLALVLQRICDLTIGIFIAQFTLNIIFIGLIAVGLPDTFQNVVLGFFLLVVMILFENLGRIEELKEKRAARQKAMSAS
ncbi:MAG: ABC transporter permease [Blautia faecis]